MSAELNEWPATPEGSPANPERVRMAHAVWLHTRRGASFADIAATPTSSTDPTPLYPSVAAAEAAVRQGLDLAMAAALAAETSDDDRAGGDR